MLVFSATLMPLFAPSFVANAMKMRVLVRHPKLLLDLCQYRYAVYLRFSLFTDCFVAFHRRRFY